MRTSVLRKIGGYRPDLPHAGDFEMWLRAAAVSDVGFLVGVDQAYYRQHSDNMHRRAFESGSAHGQLIDLKQRWLVLRSGVLGHWQPAKRSRAAVYYRSTYDRESGSQIFQLRLCSGFPRVPFRGI